MLFSNSNCIATNSCILYMFMANSVSNNNSIRYTHIILIP